MSKQVTKSNGSSRGKIKGKKNIASAKGKAKQVKKGKANLSQQKKKTERKRKKVQLGKTTREYEKAYVNIVPSTIRPITFLKIGAFIGLLVQLLFFQPVLTIVAFVIAGFYGLKVIVPYNIRSAYENYAFVQRNIFINSMTQVLTNPQRTIIDAFKVISERLEGEFKKDIEILFASLTGSSEDEIYSAYRDLKNNYQDDIIFGQYVDQLATATIEGRANLETFKNIKTYHNDFKKRRQYFLNRKMGNMKEIQSMFLVIFIFILAICFSNGLDAYIRSYAHSIIGIITNCIFLVLFFFFVLQFYKYYRDDNIWGG